MIKSESALVVCAYEFVKKVLKGVDSAHDFAHSQRVYKNAIKLLDDSVDRETVLVCALLHDVADKKLFDDEHNLDEFFLLNPTAKECKIRLILSEISFSAGKKCTSKESEIVQDADRLDAIGAIGIARAFSYGGAHNRAIYGDDAENSLAHFYQKLFKIKGMLNTQKAKEMADERDKFMYKFIEQLRCEID